MVGQTPRYRSYDRDIKPYDENPTDHRVAPYKFGQSARTDHPENSVPLFLSDYDDEPDPSEYITPVQNGRGSYISSRILAGVSATAAMAILVAVFSSDAARDIIANAKDSSTAVLSAASAAVQPNPTQPTARKDPAQSKDATRPSAPEVQTLGLRSVTTATVAPTRDDIKTALQSAQHGDAPHAAATADPIFPSVAIHHPHPTETTPFLS